MKGTADGMYIMISVVDIKNIENLLNKLYRKSCTMRETYPGFTGPELTSDIGSIIDILKNNKYWAWDDYRIKKVEGGEIKDIEKSEAIKLGYEFES